MGDLNAHTGLSRRLNRAGRNLNEFIHNNGAVVLNEPGQPTSFWRNDTVESNSILNIFIGTELFYDKLLDYKVLTRSEVDLYQGNHYHVPVRTCFNLTKKQALTNQSRNQAYNFYKADWDAYQDCLSSISSSINTSSEPEEIAITVVNSIVSAMKTSVPLVKKSNRQQDLPPYLVNLIKEKNYWQRRFKKTRSEQSRDNLYSLKEAVKYELYKFSSFKMKKFVDSLGKAPLSTKPLWKRVNRLRGQSRNGIPTLIVNGAEIEGDEIGQTTSTSSSVQKSTKTCMSTKTLEKLSSKS